MVVAAASLAVAGSGCQRPPTRHVHLAALPDRSASIEPRAEADVLTAMSNAFKAMGRGDSVAVIPITADADDDQGHVLRWRLPTTRQPFDGDLLHLAKEERSDLRELLDSTQKRPYRWTDILGALHLAQQELSDDPPTTLKAIVILSDFIEDDPQYHFAKDRRLRDEESARRFALSPSQSSKGLTGIKVYLGGLASRDLRKLPKERREAIRTFWETFLIAQGAEVEWATDGPGRLDEFIRHLREDSTLETAEHSFSTSTATAEN
jgi:hypothetical protein